MSRIEFLDDYIPRKLLSASPALLPEFVHDRDKELEFQPLLEYGELRGRRGWWEMLMVASVWRLQGFMLRDRRRCPRSSYRKARRGGVGWLEKASRYLCYSSP